MRLYALEEGRYSYIVSLRQLWRVLERSSCVVGVIDGRNPKFYISEDLKQYAKELGKPMLLIVNKV